MPLGAGCKARGIEKNRKGPMRKKIEKRLLREAKFLNKRQFLVECLNY